MKQKNIVFSIVIAISPVQALLFPYTRSILQFHRMGVVHSHTKSRINTIEHVISKTDILFKTVPGYTTVVKKLYSSFNGLAHHTSNGFLYELQTALEFYEQGHDICAFEKTYTNACGTCAREFDIITNLCAIECKAVNWHIIEKSPQRILKIQRQIVDQKALVDSGVVGVPYYILCSKNEIPPQYKTWLQEQRILYYISTPSAATL